MVSDTVRSLLVLPTEKVVISLGSGLIDCVVSSVLPTERKLAGPAESVVYLGPLHNATNFLHGQEKQWSQILYGLCWPYPVGKSLSLGCGLTDSTVSPGPVH